MATEDEDFCKDDDVNSFLVAHLSLPLLGGWKYPRRLSSLVREEQCIFVLLDSVDFDSYAEANDDDDIVVAAVDASMDVDVDVDVDTDDRR